MSEPLIQQILDGFLPEHFSAPGRYFEYILSQKIKDTYGGMQHLIIMEFFALSPFLRSQNVAMKITEKHRVHYLDNNQNGVASTLKVGFIEFTWSGTDFLVYKISCQEGPGQAMYHILFHAGENNAERNKVGEDLIVEAFKWYNALKDEIYVFSGGGWQKNGKLWKAIQLSSWDSLVLDEEFVSNLKRDTTTFFSSREVYESLDIPWKRGILLLGPPGNGKTESIKALLKESGIPSLYVKSFNSVAGSEAGIRIIFEFARRQAPCILVIEDLDCMVVPSNRSFFLNEMDGLERNEGVLVIATSNHPERIDESLINRPSRFDVKYMFQLPSYELRKSYIEKWAVKIRNLHNIDFKNEAYLREMAEQTEGFSFAFLKELFVSFLLRMAHDRTFGKDQGDPGPIMSVQIKQLKAQIELGEKERRGADIGTHDNRAFFPHGMNQPFHVMGMRGENAGSDW